MMVILVHPDQLKEAIMPEHMMNGIDVGAMKGAIKALKQDPELAQFKFRVRNRWIDGTKNHASVQGFYGAKEEHPDRKAKLEYDLDEAPALLGEDTGPNPVEYLLIGLSGCITTTLVAYASARGLKINSIRSELEGDLDIQGFMDVDKSVPTGYKEIRFKFHIDADAPREELEELAQFAKMHSPVAGTVMNATPVNVRVEKH